ncbi:MAG: histidine kinase [Flavobacteriales bacterium]
MKYTRSISTHPFLILSILVMLRHGHSFAQEATLTRYCQENRFNPIEFSNRLKRQNPKSLSIRILKVYEKSLNGNYKGFIHNAERLISINNRSIKNPYLIHLKQLEVSEYYLLTGEFNAAKKELERSVHYARKKRENHWVSQSYRLFSKVYLHENKKDSADLFIRRAIEFAKRSTNELELALCLHQSAENSAQFSNIQEAVTQELLALQVVEKLNNTYYECIFNRFIAELSLDAGNLRESENYLRKCQLKSGRISSKRLKLENDILRARIEIRKGFPNEVLVFLPSSVKGLEQLKDYLSLGEAWMVLGEAYNAAGQINQSLEAFNSSLTYFEQSRQPEKMASVYHQIGLVLLSKNDLLNAEKNILKAIVIRNNIKERTRIYESYFALSNVYAAQGQKQKAYDYLKRHTDFLRRNSFSIDSKKIEDLTQTNSREERERLIETQEEKLQKELKEKEILQLQSDRQLLGISIVIAIFFLSAVSVFFIIRQRNTLQEQRESEMSQTLLRSQMNPHFIFNALAVIQSYIYENTPEKTSKFLVNFSRLIRLILENSPKEFITIDIENEILSKYLTTQKLRFEDRFNFKIDIDEELMFRRALIPPMITQPFIENSIEHGQLHTIEDGMIEVSMKENQGMLEVVISDNGVGRTKAGKIKKNKSHKSMALEITRERIEIMNKKYKGKGSLSIEDLNVKEKTGTRVIICLPIIYENTTFGSYEKSTDN